MDPKELVILTTFRLSDTRQALYNLKRWKSEAGVSTCALIEEKDYISNPADIELLKNGADILIPYKAHIDSVASRQYGKRSPRIIDILETMKGLKGFKYYAYANADIELRVNKRGMDLCRKIDELSSGRRIIFAHRRDYSSEAEGFAYYMQGLDFFVFPNKALEEIEFSQGIYSCQIGQVGWDYMLPLCMPASQVLTTCRLPIYHEIHPTGSTADWSEAIMNLLPHIHPTWTNEKPIMKIVLRISGRLNSSLENRKSIPPTNDWCKRAMYYFWSRVLFYGFIQRLFSNCLY